MNDELTLNGTYINIAYHNSRVSELEKQLAKYDEIAAEYGIDGKTMLTLAKSQIETAKENIVLREHLKAEREKGCEYCNNTDYIFESQQKIETPQWDEYEDGFIVIRQHINFCPMCGKRLEVEHGE